MGQETNVVAMAILTATVIQKAVWFTRVISPDRLTSGSDTCASVFTVTVPMRLYILTRITPIRITAMPAIRVRLSCSPNMNLAINATNTYDMLTMG